MQHTDLIRETLEGKECISYRYVAVELHVDVDAAKRMLYEFHTKFGQYFATISICGLNKDGMYRTVVVPHSEGDAARVMFSKIMSEFIYSLHANKSSVWQEQVAQLDFEQMSNLFCDDSYMERVNAISHVACDLKENVRLPSGTKISVNRVVPAAVVRTATVPPPSSSGSGAKASALVSAKTLSVPTSGFFSSSNGAPAKAAVSSAVSGFFSKSAAPAKPKPAVDESKPSQEAASASASAPAPAPSHVTASTRVIHDDDDDDEWDDGSGYKPQKANLAKRAPKSKSILDDDEAWDNASKTAASEPTPMDIESTDESRGKKSKHAVVHRGAMDDFVSDGSFEGDAKVASAGAGGGERKKKLVEKTFENEKGYLVTEMVWEEMSDEEVAELARQAEAAAAAAEKRAAAAAAKKAAAPPPKKAAPTGGAQQKGMMSFFGKKQ